MWQHCSTAKIKYFSTHIREKKKRNNAMEKLIQQHYQFCVSKSGTKCFGPGLLLSLSSSMPVILDSTAPVSQQSFTSVLLPSHMQLTLSRDWTSNCYAVSLGKRETRVAGEGGYTNAYCQGFTLVQGQRSAKANTCKNMQLDRKLNTNSNPTKTCQLYPMKSSNVNLIHCSTLTKKKRYYMEMALGS